MANNSFTPSTRHKIFSSKESTVLIALVKEYAHILENKKSNAVTWKEKLNGWEKLSQEFYKLTGNNRSSKNLKGKWENMKKETKKKFSCNKQELYQTGGGSFTQVTLTNQDFDIKALLGSSVAGLTNKFDSDSLANSVPELRESSIAVQVDNSVGATTEFNITQELPDVDDCVDLSTNSSLIKFHLQNPSTQLPSTQLSSTQISSAQPPSTLLASNSFDEDVRENNSEIQQADHVSTDNWAKVLKTPKSSTLCNKEKKVTRPVRKSDITNECKRRISALAAVKLELFQLEIQSLKEENRRKQKEHEDKLQQQKEIQELEIERKKLQLDLLKKEILK